MRTIKLAGCFALAVFALLCCSAAGKSAKPLTLTARADGAVAGVGGRYALVIGIDDYSRAGLGSLQFSEKDALAMRDALVNYGGFPTANVTLLVGRQATLENILHYLANLQQPGIFPDGDTFVLYFSGHGGQIQADSTGPNSSTTKDQYLVPANGTSDSVLAQNLNIPLATVLRALDGSVFKRKVLLLDACRVTLHTGGAKAGATLSAFNLSPYTAAVGVKGMAGALPGQISWEDASLGDSQLGRGHGVFTYYLLRGLYGGAADANYVVTFNGLDDYAASGMAQYSRDHPDKAQTPQPFGEGNGGIALTLAPPAGTQLIGALRASATSSTTESAEEITNKLELNDIHGRRWSFDELIGDKQILLIAVWQVGCRPCNELLDYLQALQQESSASRISFVVVSHDTPLTLAQVAPFFAERESNYRAVLIDPALTLTDALEIRGTPVTVAINRERHVVYRQHGFKKQFEQSIAAALDYALAGAPALSDRGMRMLGVSLDFSLAVTQLDPSGPAAQAGLQVGDRLLHVGPKHLVSLVDFVEAMRGAAPGQEVNLVYWSAALERENKVLPQLSARVVLVDPDS